MQALLCLLSLFVKLRSVAMETGILEFEKEKKKEEVAKERNVLMRRRSLQDRFLLFVIHPQHHP